MHKVMWKGERFAFSCVEFHRQVKVIGILWGKEILAKKVREASSVHAQAMIRHRVQVPR